MKSALVVAKMESVNKLDPRDLSSSGRVEAYNICWELIHYVVWPLFSTPLIANFGRIGHIEDGYPVRRWRIKLD